MNEGQTLYIKQPNGRYKVWGHCQEWDQDAMAPGQFRLQHCAPDGSRRYSYDVSPDTAAFLAAAEVAAVAMEGAIQEAAKMQPQGQPGRRLTARQGAVMREVRRMMDEAGIFTPVWWESTSDRDIAAAGIAAVRAVHEQQQQDAQAHSTP